MSKKLYVGNLGSSVGGSDLENLFSDYGTVNTARILVDEVTRRSKGVGIVEMDTDEEAQAAARALDGATLDGRAMTVGEMRPIRFHGGKPLRASPE